MNNEPEKKKTNNKFKIFAIIEYVILLIIILFPIIYTIIIKYLSWQTVAIYALSLAATISIIAIKNKLED